MQNMNPDRLAAMQQSQMRQDAQAAAKGRLKSFTPDPTAWSGQFNGPMYGHLNAKLQSAGLGPMPLEMYQQMYPGRYAADQGRVAQGNVYTPEATQVKDPAQLLKRFPGLLG